MTLCTHPDCEQALPLPYSCKYCESDYCSEHRFPEAHECSGLQNPSTNGETSDQLATQLAPEDRKRCSSCPEYIPLDQDQCETCAEEDAETPTMQIDVTDSSTPAPPESHSDPEPKPEPEPEPAAETKPEPVPATPKPSPSEQRDSEPDPTSESHESTSNSKRVLQAPDTQDTTMRSRVFEVLATYSDWIFFGLLIALIAIHELAF